MGLYKEVKLMLHVNSSTIPCTPLYTMLHYSHHCLLFLRLISGSHYGYAVRLAYPAEVTHWLGNHYMWHNRPVTRIFRGGLHLGLKLSNKILMALHDYMYVTKLMYNSLKKQTRCFHSAGVFANKNFTNSVNINSCVVMGVHESQSS